MFIPNTDHFKSTFSKEGLYDNLKDLVDYYYNRAIDDVPEERRKSLAPVEELSDDNFQWFANRVYDFGVNFQWFVNRVYDFGVNLEGIEEGEEDYAGIRFDHCIEVFEYLSDNDLLIEPKN